MNHRKHHPKQEHLLFWLLFCLIIAGAGSSIYAINVQAQHQTDVKILGRTTTDLDVEKTATSKTEIENQQKAADAANTTFSANSAELDKLAQ